MNCKIMTFAIILETPVPDKNKVKEILISRGYHLKNYDIGLMEAYDKDGNKIDNKLESDPQTIEKYNNDMYQLKGKYCNVDFSRENPIIFYQFRTKMEQVQYDFAKNLEEIKSIISILKQFVNYDRSPSELLISLEIQGKQNPDATLLNLRKKSLGNFIVKNTYETISDLKNAPSKFLEERLKHNPPSPAEHLEVHYTGVIDSKSRNTETTIHARDEKYTLVLRFNSIGTDDVLCDLASCEEFGLNIIEKLESASKLD